MAVDGWMAVAGVAALGGSVAIGALAGAAATSRRSRGEFAARLEQAIARHHSEQLDTLRNAYAKLAFESEQQRSTLLAKLTAARSEPKALIAQLEQQLQRGLATIERLEAELELARRADDGGELEPRGFAATQVMPAGF